MAIHYDRVVQRCDEDELKMLAACHQGLEARTMVATVIDEVREYRQCFQLG